MSERTTRLLGGDRSLTPTLRDLGAHHLKDLPEPERLFQLLADGLLSSFPPPRVHEEAIEAAGLPDYSVPPADVPCPYKGLLPFEPEDSEFFFGREHLAEDVAARVEATGFLAVVGPSGSGKSSLVRAGVVPALQRSADGELRTAIFAPGTHPLAQLDDAREAPLLVVDQFEEVFTLCRDEEERAAFIDALLDRAANGAWVVVALRADFYGHCATYPRLAGALEERQALVGPMTEEELRRAIERPGEQAGLVLEPGMVEAILRDVAGQPGALPLLSHSLLETWKRRSGRMLTVIGYLQSGGVQGAIAKTAETVYDALSPQQQALARNVFLRLTELGEGTEDTRRRVSIAELFPRPEQEVEVREVLRTLADARLVTIGEGTVEVAHEALIRHWPKLREWLDEDREGRLLHRRLTEAAQEWEALGRDPGALLRGTRLATTGDWATAHDPELNQLEREFLTASRQASQAEAERQRRANRRLRGLLVGAVVLLALALVAGVVALVQRSRARDAQSRAEEQALRSDAERLGTLALAEPKLDRSLLLAVAGFKLEDLPETRGDLLSVLQKSPALIGVAHVSRTDMPAIAASEHDGLLASGDSAGVVHFTDTRTWRPSGTAVHLDGPVSQDAMEFSPDGSTLAVATTKGDERVNLYLVDVATRKSRLVCVGSSVPAVLGPRRFTRMAFSPDGTRLAVAVATAPTPSPTPLRQRLLLLAVPTGFVVWERRYPLLPGQNEVAVAFTPQGTLVSSAQQGETLVWDPKSGRIMRRFGIGGPFGVSPNGTRLAVAQNNANPAVQKASLAVLDLRTGRHRSLRPLPVPGWLVSVRFAHRWRHRRPGSRLGRARLGRPLRCDHRHLLGGRRAEPRARRRPHSRGRRAGRNDHRLGCRRRPSAGEHLPLALPRRRLSHDALHRHRPARNTHGRVVRERHCRTCRSPYGATGRHAATEDGAARGRDGVLAGRPDARHGRRERQGRPVGHAEARGRPHAEARRPRVVGSGQPGREAACATDPGPRSLELTRRGTRCGIGAAAVPAKRLERQGRSGVQPRRAQARRARLLRAGLDDRGLVGALGEGPVQPAGFRSRHLDRVFSGRTPLRGRHGRREGRPLGPGRRVAGGGAGRRGHGTGRSHLLLAGRTAVRRELG